MAFASSLTVPAAPAEQLPLARPCVTAIVVFASYGPNSKFVTDQVELDSYTDAGVLAAVALVNGLTKGFARGRPMGDIDPLAVIGQALAVDPPSVAVLEASDGPGFIALAERLREVFVDLDRGDVDAAARRVNNILAMHPATPHLAKEDGVWRLHHHTADAPVLPMWTSICAEGLARMIGAQAAHRLGVCLADKCDRVFVDTTRNASRRFCSIACQNRTKTAAFRSRHARPPKPGK